MHHKACSTHTLEEQFKTTVFMAIPTNLHAALLDTPTAVITLEEPKLVSLRGLSTSFQRQGSVDETVGLIRGVIGSSFPDVVW